MLLRRLRLRTGCFGASSLYVHDENLKPYCFVKTIDVVSCSVLNHPKSMPSQPRTEVIDEMSSDSMSVANCAPRRGTTAAPGVRRSRASCT